MKRQLLSTGVAAAISLCLLLGYALYRATGAAIQLDVRGQTSTAAAVTAVAIMQAIHGDEQLAGAVEGEYGLDAVLQGNASNSAAYTVFFSNLSIQRANPQLLGLYFYDHTGRYVLSQVLNAGHRPQHGLGELCESTGTYCQDSNPPTDGFLGSAGLHAGIMRIVQSKAHALIFPAFDRQAGPFGYLYILQPLLAAGGDGLVGAVLEQIDAASIFAPYVQAHDSQTLIISGNVVLGPELETAHNRGQLPVLTAKPSLTSAFTGGLAPTPVGFALQGTHPRFTLGGATVLASLATVAGTDLRVVSYAPIGILSTANVLLILATMLFVAALLAVIVVLAIYLRNLLRQREQSSTLVREAQAMTGELPVRTTSKRLAGEFEDAPAVRPSATALLFTLDPASQRTGWRAHLPSTQTISYTVTILGAVALILLILQAVG